jgi:hypothetical protein
MMTPFIERTECAASKKFDAGLSKIIPGDWGKVGTG